MDKRIFTLECALEAIQLFPMSENDVRKLVNGEIPNHKIVSNFCFNLAEEMANEAEKRGLVKSGLNFTKKDIV